MSELARRLRERADGMEAREREDGMKAMGRYKSPRTSLLREAAAEIERLEREKATVEWDLGEARIGLRAAERLIGAIDAMEGGKVSIAVKKAKSNLETALFSIATERAIDASRPAPPADAGEDVSELIAAAIVAESPGGGTVKVTRVPSSGRYPAGYSYEVINPEPSAAPPPLAVDREALARALYDDDERRMGHPDTWEPWDSLEPHRREPYTEGAACVADRLARHGGAAEPKVPFQARVKSWLVACFGEDVASDRAERNHRFLEEALELVQANGIGEDDCCRLVDYVYGRPPGDPRQEVGGTMTTLAALCGAIGIDMEEAAEAELARVWTKIEKIRAKQAAKPKNSPLPEHPAGPAAPGEGEPLRPNTSRSGYDDSPAGGPFR